MFNMPTTGTDIAKYGLKMVVASGTARVSRDFIVDHTDADEDSKAVNLGSTLIGMYAASKLEPITDAIVDQTVNRFKSWKTRKQNVETPAA